MDTGLLHKVFRKIQYERIRLAKIRLAYSSVLGFMSAVILVSLFGYFLREFSQSGFYQYLSLAPAADLSYWKELTLSLLESFPVLSTAAILSVVFAMLLLVKYISRNAYHAFKTQTI